MNKRNRSRRNMLKATIVSFFVGPLMLQVTQGHEFEVESDVAINSDYFIINGWLLLKSDVMLDS